MQRQDNDGNDYDVSLLRWGPDGTPITYIVYNLDSSQGEERGQSAGDSTKTPQESSDQAQDAYWLTNQAEGGLVNPGVSKLGAEGGIRPSSDKELFKNVFGDPRVKVITVESSQKLIAGTLSIKATLAFRIATVQLADGQVRTRLMMNVIDGNRRGLSRIIEIDTKDAGFDHASLYDYDFDVDVINTTESTLFDLLKSSYDTIVIAMVSGARNKGNDTSFTSAATDLVFSCRAFSVRDLLGYNDSGQAINSLPSIFDLSLSNEKHGFSMKGAMVTGGDSNMIHSVSSLQIVREGNDLSTAKWIISFLDRFGKTAEDVLSNDKSRSDVRMGIAIYDYQNRLFIPIKEQDTHGKLGSIDDLSVYEHVLFPKIGNGYTLMLRGSEKAYYYLVSLDTGTAALKGAKRCKSYDASARLTFWPGHGCFLTSAPTDATQLEKRHGERDYSSWTLHKATWSNGDTPELQLTVVGPQSFNISNFALNPTGTFMFWPQTREVDTDRVFNALGEPDEKERPASYHIMACRLRGEKFSDPFIVADLPHDTDALAVLSTDHGAALEMLGTEYRRGTRKRRGVLFAGTGCLWTHHAQLRQADVLVPVFDIVGVRHEAPATRQHRRQR